MFRLKGLNYLAFGFTIGVHRVSIEASQQSHAKVHEQAQLHCLSHEYEYEQRQETGLDIIRGRSVFNLDEANHQQSQLGSSEQEDAQEPEASHSMQFLP